MGIIIFILVVFFVLRFLRSKYEWVDTVLGLIVLGAPICVWIAVNFWVALLVLVVLAMIYGLMIKDNTKVTINGKRYKLECKECDFEELEILSRVENGVIARCKRCGNESLYMTNK